MSKLALYAALGGSGAVVATAVAVATGALDLDRMLGREAAPQSAALIAPQTGSPDQPQAPASPSAALKADPAAQPEPEAQPAPEPEQSAAPEKSLAPEQTAAEQTAAAAPNSGPNPGPDAAEPSVAAPSFDLVRTEVDGSTMVVGAGTPGAQVEVLVDGQSVSDTQIGSDGKFVAFVDPLETGQAHVVTLLQKQAGQETPSQDEVLIAPLPAPQTAPQIAAQTTAQTPAPEEEAPAPQGQPLAASDPAAPSPAAEQSAAAQSAPTAAGAPDTAVLAEANPEASPEASPVAGQAPPDVTTELAAAAPKPAQAPQTAEAQAPAPQIAPSPFNLSAPDASEAPKAPAVFLSGPGGIEVLQTAPLSPGDVALDSISYDDAGEVLLAGRGEQTAFVRVYLDNAPVTTSRIREDGRWRVALPQVDTGTYTLRVDQLDQTGDVIARVESPFLRESAETLQAAAATGPITAITVQPGATLWAIARDRYGEGQDYLKVFQANKERIRNPDLIYPGQIFDLPDQ